MHYKDKLLHIAHSQHKTESLIFTPLSQMTRGRSSSNQSIKFHSLVNFGILLHIDHMQYIDLDRIDKMDGTISTSLCTYFRFIWIFLMLRFPSFLLYYELYSYHYCYHIPYNTINDFLVFDPSLLFVLLLHVAIASQYACPLQPLSNRARINFPFTSTIHVSHV